MAVLDCCLRSAYDTIITPEKLKQTAHNLERVILSPGSEGNSPANKSVKIQDDADNTFTTAASVFSRACYKVNIVLW